MRLGQTLAGWLPLPLCWNPQDNYLYWITTSRHVFRMPANGDLAKLESYTFSGKEGGECAYMEQQLKFICSVTNIEFCGTVLCPFTDTLPDIDGAAAEFEKMLKRSLSDE